MHEKKISVFLISKPQAQLAEIGIWLGSLGCCEETLDKYADASTEMSDGEFGVMLAAKRCYLAFEPGLNPNVTRVRENWHNYFENILKSGHGSVLEHATFSFAIEGVTRVFTGEMNRHRAGVAISEGSMRYISFDDIPFWMPISLSRSDSDSDDIIFKKGASRSIFRKAFAQMEENYKELVSLWGLNDPDSFATCDCVNIGHPVGSPDLTCTTCGGKGKVRTGGLEFHRKKQLTSMFRRIIGMGVSTGGVWTMNLRALRHIIALRTDPAAEEEIAYVVGEIGRIMVANCGLALQDFSRDENTGAWVPEYKKV